LPVSFAPFAADAPAKVLSEVKKDEGSKRGAFVFRVTWGAGEVSSIEASHPAGHPRDESDANPAAEQGASAGSQMGPLPAWQDDGGGEGQGELPEGSGHGQLSAGPAPAPGAAHGKDKKEKRVRQAKIAATAAGGVVIGVLTAGVGLVVGGIVAATAAAAGGGMAAYEAAKDKEARILVSRASTSWQRLRTEALRILATVSLVPHPPVCLPPLVMILRC